MYLREKVKGMIFNHRKRTSPVVEDLMREKLTEIHRLLDISSNVFLTSIVPRKY
jgi:hypothetical protein